MKTSQNIINFLIGKCGKTQNVKNIVKIYLNKDEAYYYAKLYNGHVYPISSCEFIEDITFSDDIFVEHFFDKSFISAFAYKRMYLVTIEKKCRLDENLLPIKHFIYVNQRLKNLRLYRHLVNNGIKPYGIRTDSILVSATEEKKVRSIFDFTKRIGGLKIEYDKTNCDKYIELKTHNMIKNSEREVITYDLKNEENFFHDPESYNNEIRDILNKHNLIMIWSVYAGGGKSFASSLTGKLYYLLLHTISFVKNSL